MKAIAYCSASIEEQTETAYFLADQAKECLNFAFRLGYEIGTTFIDDGVSSRRPALHKLIKYSMENKNNAASIVLVVWKYDRLARLKTDQLKLLKHFCFLGIRIITVKDNHIFSGLRSAS